MRILSVTELPSRNGDCGHSAATVFASCNKKGKDGEKKTVQKSEDDFLDKDAKTNERNISLRRNRSLSQSPADNTQTLTRYLSSHATAIWANAI